MDDNLSNIIMKLIGAAGPLPAKYESGQAKKTKAAHK